MMTNERVSRHDLDKHYTVLQKNFTKLHGKYIVWCATMKHMLSVLESQIDVTERLTLLQSGSSTEMTQLQRQFGALSAFDGLPTSLVKCQYQQYENFAFSLRADVYELQDVVETVGYLEEQSREYIRRQIGSHPVDMAAGSATSHSLSFYVEGIAAWSVFFVQQFALIRDTMEANLSVSTKSLKHMQVALVELQEFPVSLMDMLEAALYQP
eukprot:CFRG3453T1